MSLRTILACAAVLSLAGCGVIYTVPDVVDGENEGFAYRTDFDVEIVPLTYETVVAANLQQYVPPRLPLAFQANAVDVLNGGMGMTASGAAAVREGFDTPDRLPPRGQQERYRIGIGDVLLLATSQEATSLAGVPALISAQSRRAGYTVQDDGAIAVPDAGRIPVADMTLQDAEQEIFRALAAAGIDPAFSLEVAEFNSQHVTVHGMVGAPAVVPITLQPVTLEDALTLSGGLAAEDPYTSKIRIYRDANVYQIGIGRYLNDPAIGKVLLRDGDDIYVGAPIDRTDVGRSLRAETEAQLDRDQQLFEKRLSYGAVERPYAFLAGEVGRTVEIELPFERKLSLANVLFSKDGGGLDMTVADYSQIYVLRRETDPQKIGGLTAYRLDAENAANLAIATEFDIHANDIVFVSTQPVTSWNRVLSQLTPTPQFLSTTRRQVAASP